MEESEALGIINLRRFIEATRDAGYKNITAALAELVDNAFEAEAQMVRIDVEKLNNSEISVTTNDDGIGMKPSDLRLALQFGGSTRFNLRWAETLPTPADNFIVDFNRYIL